MNRALAFVSPFFLVALALTLPAGCLAGAGRQPPSADESASDLAEQEQKFNFYLDQGLSAYVNEQDYDVAIRNFEAALLLKPKNTAARKALRLAREKKEASKESSPPPSPQAEQAPVPDVPKADAIETSTAAAPAAPPAEKMIFTPVQAPPSLPGHPVKEDLERDAREREGLIKKHYREGIMAYMDEDYSEAVEAMKAVLEIDPDNGKARKLLMKAYSFAK